MNNDLKFIQKEAQEKHDQIQNFLSAFIPEFRESTRYSTPPSALPDPEPSLPSIKIKTDDGLPLPKVSYDWEESKGYGSVPTYLPRLGHALGSSYSNFRSKDELHLTLKFENLSSKHLPSKIELEIRDSTGNVVFKKRQNIYYVKIQEKLSTLDSAEDYVMTVTSITGIDKTSEKVTIHNKHYDPDKKGQYSVRHLPVVIMGPDNFDINNDYVSLSHSKGSTSRHDLTWSNRWIGHRAAS